MRTRRPSSPGASVPATPDGTGELCSRSSATHSYLHASGAHARGSPCQHREQSPREEIVFRTPQKTSGFWRGSSFL